MFYHQRVFDIAVQRNGYHLYVITALFTHSHYPGVTAPEFADKSRIGPYGDAILELDHSTERVLAALEKAGVDDNTIVIWLSDNGVTPVTGLVTFVQIKIQLNQ